MGPILTLTKGLSVVLKVRDFSSCGFTGQTIFDFSFEYDLHGGEKRVFFVIARTQL